MARISAFTSSLFISSFSNSKIWVQILWAYTEKEKARDRKTGKVKIKTTNLSEVENRDLILVDDMISTGGSLIKATQFLKKQKCKRIYVACTHALLINDAEKKIKKAGVTSIISTNTIPGKTSKVDISNTIAKAIM